MRPYAPQDLVNADLEAVLFEVSEAVARLNQALDGLHKLAGRLPPTPPEPAPKPKRHISPNAEWLTIADAAEIAGVSRNAIWRWCQQGLSHVNPGGGGRTKISRRALQAWIVNRQAR